MPQLPEILAAVERLAPARHALGFDRVGLQVEPASPSVDRVVVSLDRSMAAIERAVAVGAGLLVVHHPLLFRPLERVISGDDVGRAVLRLARSGVGLLAAHTNWDAAREGVSVALAARFGLTDVAPFGQAAPVETLQFVGYVPIGSAEWVRRALAKAGAGTLGDYRGCSFSVEGTGRFEPLPGASPAVGAVGREEAVAEVRVEVMVLAPDRAAVERAFLAAHPYETPAYAFVPSGTVPEMPLSRVGTLPEALSLRDLAARADAVLATRTLAWGDPDRTIHRLAVAGGAADGEWRAARRAGADALLTGEVKQHVALEAAESGFALLQCGHYATEQPGVEALGTSLAREVPGLGVEVFEPTPGFDGRPL